MARSAKPRRICEMPSVNEFYPSRDAHTEKVILTIDEFEAIRLIDFLGLTQEECASQMNVSRTTVQAIYDSGRKKLADALVNGKTLVIHGGSYSVCPQSQRCCGKNCRDHLCRHKNCPSRDAACEKCDKFSCDC